MRNCMPIKPEWLNEVAPHFHKKKDMEALGDKKMPKSRPTLWDVYMEKWKYYDLQSFNSDEWFNISVRISNARLTWRTGSWQLLDRDEWLGISSHKCPVDSSQTLTQLISSGEHSTIPLPNSTPQCKLPVCSWSIQSKCLGQIWWMSFNLMTIATSWLI